MGGGGQAVWFQTINPAILLVFYSGKVAADLNIRNQSSRMIKEAEMGRTKNLKSCSGQSLYLYVL